MPGMGSQMDTRLPFVERPADACLPRFDGSCPFLMGNNVGLTTGGAEGALVYVFSDLISTSARGED